MGFDLRGLIDILRRPPGFGPAPETITPTSEVMRTALERHKQEGETLAIGARIWSLSVTAVLLLFIVDWPEVVYYQALLGVFVVLGIVQRRLAGIGRNTAELWLLFADILLLAVICLVPNPLSDDQVPLAFQYRYDVFNFFFVFLAAATLAYAWQTVVAIGVWTAAVWVLGLLAILYLDTDPGAVGAEARAFHAGDPRYVQYLDPTNPLLNLRLQELVVFLIVAGILAVASRRSTRLLLRQVEAERGRANLSRYFSPNVVDSLSQSDEPLREVREQDVAVLFVDLVGFTAYAAARPAERVIGTLRDFHGRMEAAVFAHGGTLDKYLGDGLMATFGTPFAGTRDASNALACVHAMIAAVDQLNAERVAQGRQPLRASFGLHYGPVVLGDIGSNRLEFAVIGNTVNVASRLEALTRSLDVRLVVSDSLIEQVAREGDARPETPQMTPGGPQTVRGLDSPLVIWTLR